ncbi:CPK1, partial [Symbiodinium necroappetens]
LDELEAFQLVKFVLRRARDRMMPSNVMRVGQLPRKDLQKEFELVKKLGAGGQGAVYLAKEKTRSGPERVVKFFTKAGAQLALDDLKEEVNILRCLDHPAIARVLDIFEDPQNVYLVAEPYFGGDLTDLMNKAAKHNVQPTHEWLGKIFRQILE